jgi:hypothetical protein
LKFREVVVQNLIEPLWLFPEHHMTPKGFDSGCGRIDCSPSGYHGVLLCSNHVHQRQEIMQRYKVSAEI